MDFTLPKLGYKYDALEPHIDAKTMEIHHLKHHQGYINNLKAAVKGTKLESKELEDVLRNLAEVPDELRTAVKNHGGGHYSHTLFWTIMSPDGGGKPDGDLAAAIDLKFGSFEAFQTKFNEEAATRFGSGWAWLSKDHAGELVLTSSSNQDNPLQDGMTPILCLDVWEHAYYLKYQNRRADYTSAWWNVINWEQVAENFKS